MAEFTSRNTSHPENNFKDTTYKNSPYLSIFRLLAYHKICNDHYTCRQWQPYNASLCNVDYLTPNSSSLLNIDDALLDIPDNVSKADQLNLLDMRFSNLPLDYFTGVLPTSQFGSESVVSLSNNASIQTSLDEGLWRVSNGSTLPSASQVLTNNNTKQLQASAQNIVHTHLS